MDTVLNPKMPDNGFPISLVGKGGLITLSAIHLVCGVILTIDIALEIHAVFSEDSTEAEHGPFLLISEIIATALLYYAFIKSSRKILKYKAALGRAKLRLAGVRNEFSGLVDRRFQEWHLSPAETEVALLTIKGLRISDIADIRDCHEGTVKSHLTAIFKKSGVSSRPELLSRFVDDFLELSSDE